MRNDLVSFENNFVQTKEAFWESEGDIVASVTIDGYPEDENEPGEVIAVVYITTHGDHVIHWANRIYQWTPQVIELVDESKKILKEIYVKSLAKVAIMLSTLK